MMQKVCSKHMLTLTSNTMQVRLIIRLAILIHWDIIIHHKTYIIHIHSARQYVGSDEDIGLHLSECLHRSITLVVVHSTVKQ